MASPSFLTVYDLYSKVGERHVIELFDDDNDGNVTSASDVAALEATMNEAESILFSRLLRAYSNKDDIVALAQNDEVIRGHCAWVALEIGSERRGFALGGEGRGQYVYQYERALKEFDLLSRGRSRSKGEEVAGTSGNVGGTLQQSVATGAPRFDFAPEIGPDGLKRVKGGY